MQSATSGAEWEPEALGSRAGHISSRDMVQTRSQLWSRICRRVSSLRQAQHDERANALAVPALLGAAIRHL
jgi:hypothetical protein